MNIKSKICILLYILFLSCSSDKVSNISKYPIITSIKELSNNYDINLDRSGDYETCTTTKYLDGSFELDYEYDLTDTYDFDPLFYSITIESQPTAKDAKDIFRFGKKTILTVNDLSGFGIEEVNSIPIIGDEYYYALRTLEGENNGFLFMIRRQNIVYTLITSGLYSTDHSIITDLVLPDIENLSDFKLID